MRTRKYTAWMGTLLMGGFLASSPALFAGAVPDSEQINKLLSEAKTQAFQLKEDATTMESFNRVNVSREGQALQINVIREHVNALGRTEVKLKDAEALASTWQKMAINRIVPFLDELNGYTSAVIEHLNGETRHTFAEYKDYLEANADYATDLAKMIDDFVAYGRTKDRLQRLTETLEVPNE